jgi:hypothetical protein
MYSRAIMSVLKAGSKGKNPAFLVRWKNKYHEDKPRGICSILVLVTPIGVTQLFLLRGFLGLLGRGFLLGWHG